MAFAYEVELYNKSGQLLEILTNDLAEAPQWRYDAVGGCGECVIKLRRDFDDFGDIGLDYDIQIHEVVDVNYRADTLADSQFDLTIGESIFGGTVGESTGSPLPATLPFALLGVKVLRYSGFIREIRPLLANSEVVTLFVSGYSRQLEYISVTKKTPPYGVVNYASLDCGEIARQIIDTYVLPGSRILRTAGAGLCQDTGVVVSADGLNFNGSAFEALKTLADIGGNAEFGVSASKEIFFTPRSQVVKQTWMIGDKVLDLEPSRGSADEIVHTVYLEGGDVGGSPFRAVLNIAPVENNYFKERVVVVPSIINAGDATLWGVSYASRFASAKTRGRITIAAIDTELSGLSPWIERQPNQVMPPLGLFRVVGGPTFLRAGAALPLQLPAQLSAASVGGTTDLSFRPHSITYTPINGGLQIQIDLGERTNALWDYQRAIEYQLSALRQRAA